MCKVYSSAILHILCSFTFILRPLLLFYVYCAIYCSYMYIVFFTTFVSTYIVFFMHIATVLWSQHYLPHSQGNRLFQPALHAYWLLVSFVKHSPTTLLLAYKYA